MRAIKYQLHSNAIDWLDKIQAPQKLSQNQHASLAKCKLNEELHVHVQCMPATINCEIYFQTEMYAFGCVWKTKKGKQKHTETNVVC